MKVNRRVIYWTAAIAVIVITFYFGYIYKPPVKKVPAKVVPVEVAPVLTGSIEETVELTGWIKAESTVVLKSKVSGRVESLEVVLEDGRTVDVEEGTAVEKGQQLGVIDHDVYLARLDAAKATVKAREVELSDAEREEKRITALYKGGSTTEQAKDKAITAARLAQANLDLAMANLELAQIDLRESTIISPIDGIVTAKHIDKGNLISVGEPIATIANMKTVKVIAGLAERYGARVEAGMTAKIRVDACEGRQFQAKVYSIYPALDEQSRTLQVEIRLDNNELLLKPGMFGRVTLVTNRKDDVIVIARDVVLGGKIDEPYVYIVADGVAHKRIVKIGIEQTDKCEITNGLEPGENLVVNGMNYLTEGSAVEVVQMEAIR